MTKRKRTQGAATEPEAHELAALEAEQARIAADYGALYEADARRDLAARLREARDLAATLREEDLAGVLEGLQRCVESGATGILTGKSDTGDRDARVREWSKKAREGRLDAQRVARREEIEKAIENDKPVAGALARAMQRFGKVVFVFGTGVASTEPTYQAPVTGDAGARRGAIVRVHLPHDGASLTEAEREDIVRGLPWLEEPSACASFAAYLYNRAGDPSVRGRIDPDVLARDAVASADETPAIGRTARTYAQAFFFVVCGDRDKARDKARGTERGKHREKQPALSYGDADFQMTRDEAKRKRADRTPSSASSAAPRHRRRAPR